MKRIWKGLVIAATVLAVVLALSLALAPELRTPAGFLWLLGAAIPPVIQTLAALRDWLRSRDASSSGNIELNVNRGGTAVIAGEIAGEGHQFGGVRIERQEIVQLTREKPEGPPWELPSRAIHFTGREEEKEMLKAGLFPARVISVCGPAGIGKTTLAAEALWELDESGELARRFPDGIVLHSFYNRPQATQAFEHIARSFGQDPTGGLEKAVGRALARRKALLVLDGAENADDLRAVLEARARCGVLLTSRRKEDAPADWIDLEPLKQRESVALLRKWAGGLAEDEAAATEICSLVGHLPLAVRLAGRYLNQQKEPATSYLVWLRKTPLAALDQGDRREESVPVLMAHSLAQVSEKARNILGLSGALALAPFEREILAEVLDVSPDELRPPLAELVGFSLLLFDGQRYQAAHALVHTYARRRLSLDAATLKQLGRVYARLAEDLGAQGPEGFRLLDAHRPHALAVLERLMGAGLWKAAGALCSGIEDYLDLQGYWTERIIVNETGVEAARRRGDRRNEGADLGSLGNAYADLGEVRRAIEHYEQALAISREIGDRRNEGAHLGSLGWAYAALGEVRRAIEHHEQALAISREIGDRRGEGAWLGSLGLAYADLGEVRRAIEHYEQALAISREIGDRRNEGAWLGNLGNAYADLGEVRQAIEHYEQALAINREIGDRRGEGAWLGNLGNAYADLGEVRRAIEHYEQALAISREIGDRRGEGADLGNLGNAYANLGEVEKAKTLVRQALEIFEQIESPHAAWARQKLAAWEEGREEG